MKICKIGISLSILIILSAWGCKKNPTFPSSCTLHIEGIVTDASNGLPISDATVELIVIYYSSESLSVFEMAITNENGHYSMKSEISGEYYKSLDIMAEAQGYNSNGSSLYWQSLKDYIRAPKPQWTNELQIINIQLRPY